MERVLASIASRGPRGIMSTLPAVVRASIFTCEQCNCETHFLGVARAVRYLGVSRSTIYYWMGRGWVHWRLLPSGRRVICLESLSHSVSGPKPAKVLAKAA